MSEGRLTARQRAGIAALLAAPTIKDAAAACGVNVATLHRWLGDATFCAELQRAQAQALEAVARGVGSAAAQAVDVLRDTMTNGDPAHRLRAAEVVLSKLAPLRELTDLERRIAELEAADGNN